MNKKGFTLVEILGVVVILGLLLLVVAPPLINRLNTHETEVTDVQKQMIEEAADLYIDGENKTLPQCITIDNLINAGYLNNNFKSTTKENINKVYVTGTNGVRSYTINGC